MKRIILLLLALALPLTHGFPPACSTAAIAGSTDLGGSGDGPRQFATVGDFPVTASDGELSMDQSSGTLYVWSAGSWQVVGAPGLITSIGALNGQPKNANAGTVSGNTIYHQTADATWPGVLTAADWSAFNAKVDSTRTISTTAPLAGGGDLSANRTLSITQSGAAQDGYLSSVDWNTFNNKFTLPALTVGSVLFSDGSTIAQDNTNFFWNDTTNILTLRNSLYRFGYTDPFSRNALWAYDTNQVILLGSWQSDGLPTNANSEGIIVYGDEALTSTPIGAANGSYARIKADRFGLFSVESTLPAYAGGQYFYRVDPTSLYLRDNAGAKTFEVTRTTGAIDTALGAGVVQSDASGVLSSAALNASQVVNTPAGNIAATDVQAAINELDSEKQAAGTSWLLAGNAGTNPGADYLGTSDAQDLHVKTNNADRLIFQSGGKVVGLQARDISDNTTEHTYEFGTYFNPSGAKTAAYARGLAGYMSYDQPNAGFSNTGGASAVFGRLEHLGSGTLGYASVFDGSIYFGANAGTTSLYKGLNLDHGISGGATITSYYGISNTANIATADINNLQIANFSIGATDLTSNGISGLNVNPNIGGTSVISGNVYAGGFYPTLDGTASVTGGIYGLQVSPQISDSAAITNSLIGLDVSPVVNDTATANDFVGLNVNQQVNNTATIANGMVGARISMAATPTQASAKGLEINMNSVDLSPAALAGGAHKYGLDIQDGSLQVGYDYTVPGASTFFQDHYIGGSTVVASGDPTAAFGFGINLAQTVNFQDDWSADASNLGFNAVGFVGSIQGTAGKTMYSWTGALGGAGNPAGAGTLSNAHMFKAAGILPQGGSLTVTNLYGFTVDTNLFCLVGTNCWGFYNDNATSENFMQKLAVNTSTKKVEAGVALDVSGVIQTDDEIRIQDPGAGTNKIVVQAPTLAADYTLTLPINDGGANECLKTDGAGVTSWGACSAGSDPTKQDAKLSVVDGGDAAYSILAGDNYIRATTTLTANRTYTLPACTAGNIGEWHDVKNPAAQTFNIVLDGNGADTVEGVASKNILPGNALSVVCVVAGEWDIR